MLDGYNRQIDYLRISVTDKCNLRCRYCMPPQNTGLSRDMILSYEEIASVACAAAELGINRIRITGGEPLVRKDICSLIRMLKKNDRIEHVGITTNGVLLKDFSEELLSAGIDSINISLDTLDPERYRRITGLDRAEDVIRAIKNLAGGRIPVKINAVSLDMSSIEEDFSNTEDNRFSDVLSLIALSKSLPVDVRFIELMPVGMGKDFKGIPHDELLSYVKKKYPGIKRDPSGHGNGPALYYRIPGFLGSTGFISPIHGVFCDSCNRIRLTSGGFLKSCLCYDTGVDLKAVLRSSRTEEEKRAELVEEIRKVILCKPKSHSFSDAEKITEKNSMSAIGG